jgi:uncharacterized linocin/CFP29 family protein
LEHRLVLEEKLDRVLLKNEEAHHIDGVKSNNAARNLELWFKSQPAGQRVSDKVSQAVEVLKKYAPHLLSA